MYEYQARVVEVIDGDTVKADIDLGFSITRRDSLRLLGINAPELHAADKAPGLAAKAYLQKLVEGATVTVRTHKDDTEKYGRLLAEIFLPQQKGGAGAPPSVNSMMVAGGFAVLYDGGKRT